MTPQTGNPLTPPPPTVVGRVCRALEAHYGSPRHGNKRNPLDELVYIILSNRTLSGPCQRAYRALKRAYPSWNLVEAGDIDDIEGILRPSGMSRLRSAHIVHILARLRAQFGAATLAPLNKMTDREAELFLTSLPGVSRKVAKCVMMYSLDRQVLPVDIHVHRVARRIGLRAKNRPDTSQDLVEEAVPPRWRYGFHVNALAHGRTTCVAGRPKCDRCPIYDLCLRQGVTYAVEALHA